MSYLNRENNYGESPSSQIYPDSEPATTPRLDDLSTFTTARLFDEIVRRAVDSRAPEDLAQDLFDFFARQSASRSERWVSSADRDFSLLERAGELAGETGELVNVSKKLTRLALNMPGNKETPAQLLDMFEREGGDVLITLLNLFNKAGPQVNLLRGFRNSFNDKSKAMGFPERV